MLWRITSHRRLGAVIGLALVSVAVLALANRAWPAGLPTPVWIVAWLGAAAVTLRSGRGRHDARITATRAHAGAELAWSALQPVLAGLAGAMLVYLALPLLAPPEVPKAPDRVRAVARELAQMDARLKVLESQQGRTPKTGAGARAAVLADGPALLAASSAEPAAAKDEPDKEKMNTWGTLFAWLLGIMALVVTAIVWSLQKGAEDIKERFDIAQGLIELKQSLALNQGLSRVLRSQLNVNELTEVTRQYKNREFQVIRLVQCVLNLCTGAEMAEFSAENFNQRVDRMIATLERPEMADIDTDALKPRVLASALRNAAEYLDAVGARPWLPAAWSDTIRRLFQGAEYLDKAG